MNSNLKKIIYFGGLLSWVIAFLIISVLRENFFLDHIEVFSGVRSLIVILFFLFSFFLYLFLYKNRGQIRPSLLLIGLAIFIIFLIPPFQSRDPAAYVISAGNFWIYHQNPYLTNVGFLFNPWVKELGKIWWLDIPIPYGFVFLMISVLSVLPNISSLIATIYIYKFIVLIAYLLSIRYFDKINSILGGKKEVVVFYALNPAILNHILIEGHNDIFTILFLLIGLYYLFSKKYNSGFFAYVLSVFIKLTSLILLPIFWFKDKKIFFKKILLSVFVLFLSFVFNLVVFRLDPVSFGKTILRIDSGCIYQCSPLIFANYFIFGDNFQSVKLFLFVSLYLFIFWRFLIKEFDIIKFIFWVFFIFFSVYIIRLAPWYLTLIIPFGLLIDEKRYHYLVFLLTFYSLFHFYI